jgi:hypothetical protein
MMNDTVWPSSTAKRFRFNTGALPTERNTTVTLRPFEALGVAPLPPATETLSGWPASLSPVFDSFNCFSDTSLVVNAGVSTLFRDFPSTPSIVSARKEALFGCLYSTLDQKFVEILQLSEGSLMYV